ncbi:MAG: Ig-like domain-containing protein, partial [Oscillospiraceae bacterium]|nr:Ig-like domain-containing protein [Oscillospiraceae bacterium]
YYDVSFVPYGLTTGGIGEVSIDSETACSKNFYGSKDGALPSESLYDKIYLSAGEHKITLESVSAGTGGGYYVAVQSFTFAPAGQLDSAKLEYSKRYVLLSETDGAKLNLSASYSDGKVVDIEKDATVTYESSDEAIAIVTQDGTVIPVSEGNVTITAKVTVGTITKEATLPLIISAEPITGFEIDFTAVNRDKLDDSEGRVNKNGTAEGPNWKFNTNRNTSTIFGANKRVRFYDSYLQLFFYSGDITNERNKLVMTFDVPATSLYDIEIFGGVVTSGGIGEFYIDNKYVDEYDFYSEVNNAQGAYDKLRQIYLTEGTHTLTIVARRSSTTSAYVLLSKIKFTECEEISPIVEVGAETERNSIAVGESEPYLIYAVQENGVKFYSKPPLKGSSLDDLKIESEATDIATIDGDLIRAVGTGDAEMKISGTVAGETAPDGKFKINVNENVYDHAKIDVVYDIFYEGAVTEISAAAWLSDGSKLNDRDITYYFTSDNTDVAEIDNDTNMLKTLKEGEAEITAHVTFNNQTMTASEKIKVVAVTLDKIEAHTEDNIVSSFDEDGSQIIVKGINNDGSEFPLTGATFIYENLSPKLIDVSEDGKVFSRVRGAAEVKVKMELGNHKLDCIVDVVSSSQKTEPTLYTYTMRKNALDNIKKYDWAKSSKETAVKDAEYWLANYEKVYDTIMYEGIPRAYSIGLHDSPDDFDYKCAYCQEDVRNHASAYGWKTDPLNRPWKIQCPACKRLFPSNDFGRFYELGLDQKRQFDRTRALEAHRTMLL